LEQCQPCAHSPNLTPPALFLPSYPPAANSSTTTAGVIAALAAAGIQPARKLLAFDTGVLAGDTAAPRIAGWVGTTAKQEGIVALGNCAVAIARGGVVAGGVG
jgi:hypothetical protein